MTIWKYSNWTTDSIGILNFHTLYVRIPYFRIFWVRFKTRKNATCFVFNPESCLLKNLHWKFPSEGLASNRPWQNLMNQSKSYEPCPSIIFLDRFHWLKLLKIAQSLEMFPRWVSPWWQQQEMLTCSFGWNPVITIMFAEVHEMNVKIMIAHL